MFGFASYQSVPDSQSRPENPVGGSCDVISERIEPDIIIASQRGLSARRKVQYQRSLGMGLRFICSYPRMPARPGGKLWCLPVGAQTLRQRLREHGLLASVDQHFAVSRVQYPIPPN
jgi:hypothetical protein